MASLEEILNMDFSYPWIDIKAELLVMLEYINQIENGFKSVCESYLNKELAKYVDAEYEDHYHAYVLAEEELPRLVMLPVVVSIYTIFENSFSRLLSYSQGK